MRAEFHHPVAGNLFGTALISLLLLPIQIAPHDLPLARTLWTIVLRAYATVVIVGLLLRTLTGIARGELKTLTG